MDKLMDLKGETFGRLKVIEMDSIQNYKVRWKCICDCGNPKIVLAGKLRSGETKSCGCLRDELSKQRRTTHGQNIKKRKSVEYNTWCSMKERCHYEKAENYYLYGGRGIRVCDRWINSFEKFLEDMGKRPSSKHSIDRIEVNGNYEPLNCKWATSEEQSRNKRVSRNNESGTTGVREDKKTGKWISRIYNDGNSIYLGYFENKNDAINARKAAEIKYWNKIPS